VLNEKSTNHHDQIIANYSIGFESLVKARIAQQRYQGSAERSAASSAQMA
jgi:hypothetical protein